MLCLRCVRGVSNGIPRLKPSSALFARKSLPSRTGAQRTLSTVVRPRILSSTQNAPTTTALAPTPEQPLDLVPKISTHPSLAGIQVRNGPRDTFDPSHRVRKRRCGFLARKRSRTGRAILKRRLLKGRRSLTH